MASVSTSWAFAPAAVSSSSTAGAVVGTTCSKFLSYFPRRVKSRNSLAASSSDETFTGEAESPDSVKLAFSKAQAYRKAKMKAPLAPVTEEKPSVEFAGDDLGIGGLGPEVPVPVNSSLEKAKEYTKNKGLSTEMQSALGQEDTILWNSTKDFLKNKSNKKNELKISSKDFLGLDFSEKKSYKRVPPGLVPSAGPILRDDVSEVEFIVGDATKFENTLPPVLALNDDNTSLYKPKVSTWGVFPRPSNISKTFGGGRVIRPGEMLDTSEMKEAKQRHTRELIATYKKKKGLTIDAKTSADCKMSLKEGDNLMDRGRLQEALPYYELVMEKLPFQSEFYGLAAFQWSICQDSLGRPNEARFMYEKLQSHPSAEVSKKARQFSFSFQAMEMMKVKGSSFSRTTGYESYFEAFLDNESNYTPSKEEQDEFGAIEQAFPYLLLLVSPIFVVLFVVLKKSISL